MTVLGCEARPLFRDGLLDTGPARNAAFEVAVPFPHVVIDDVLDVEPDEVLTQFPAPEWTGWRRYGTSTSPAN